MTLKEKITNIAESLAIESGPQNITLQDLCKRAGISAGSFQNVMGVKFTEFLMTLPDCGGHKVTLNRTKPVFRRRSILMSAVELAWNGHYATLTRDAIAKAAGVSGPTVGRYFQTMGKLKEEVMVYAIKNEIIEIIAQGIVCKNRVAMAVPARIKEKIAAYIKR